MELLENYRYIVENPDIRANINIAMTDIHEKGVRNTLETILKSNLKKYGEEDIVDTILLNINNSPTALIDIQVLSEILMENVRYKPKKAAHKYAQEKFDEGVKRTEKEIEHFVINYMLDDGSEIWPNQLISSQTYYNDIPLEKIRYDPRKEKLIGEKFFEFLDLADEARKAAEIKDTFALYNCLLDMEMYARDILEGYNTKDKMREFNKHYITERMLIKAIFQDKVAAFNAKEQNKVKYLEKAKNLNS